MPDGFLGTFGRPPGNRLASANGQGGCNSDQSWLGQRTNGEQCDFRPGNAITKACFRGEGRPKTINRLFIRILNRPATEKEIQASLALFANEIDDDHADLIRELEVAQKDIKVELDESERMRAEAIAKVESELKVYRTQTAYAVQKANDERNARIKTAEDALKSFDNGLDGKIAAWEQSHKAGKSIWRSLDMGNVTSEIPGIKFEQQEDGSVFVGEEARRAVTSSRPQRSFQDHRSACRSSVGYTVA